MVLLLLVLLLVQYLVDGAAATDKQEAVKTNGTSNNPANINVSGDQINKD